MAWVVWQARAHAMGSKYQFMEQSQQKKKEGLKDKIPDIQKTLETVRFLKTRKVCFIPHRVCRG